jgi:uncharacterized membrane protein YgdD (TMEM256/DUF423 family)
MSQRTILVVAGILGFLSVALGAFGAHALKELLEANGRSETFELAVRYQFFHTLALLFIGASHSRNHSMAALLFLLGILLFSGSLYFLALTNSTRLVMITPIGGLVLLSAWAKLVWDFIKK